MINQEIQEKFQTENGISISEASNHIAKWIEEKNFPSAENGIIEIEKFISGTAEIEVLKKNLEQAKNGNQNTSINSGIILEKKSSKNGEVVEGTVFQQDEKVLAAFSYFSFLAVLPLILKRDSELCQHHGKQGLVFAIFFFIMGKIASFIPGLGNFIEGVLGILGLIIAIFGGLQAYKGKIWKAPIAGDFVKKMKF